MDYLLSEEGQKSYLSAILEPARTGIDAPWVPKGIKLYINNPEIGDRIGYYQQFSGDIFSSAAGPG